MSVECLWHAVLSPPQAVEEFSGGLTRYTEDAVR